MLLLYIITLLAMSCRAIIIITYYPSSVSGPAAHMPRRLMPQNGWAITHGNHLVTGLLCQNGGITIEHWGSSAFSLRFINSSRQWLIMRIHDLNDIASHPYLMDGHENRKQTKDEFLAVWPAHWGRVYETKQIIMRITWCVWNEMTLKSSIWWRRGTKKSGRRMK